MNLQVILRTNLKWFILVNTISTLVFLPLFNQFVVTGAPGECLGSYHHKHDHLLRVALP